MTTAQDQQSREAYEDGKWYWVESEGWYGDPPTIAPACYRAECDAWYSAVFSGISTPFLRVLEPCEMRAARALPAPENIREGEPYDDPAFEDLARTMGVWGTAQSALCAHFFLAGRGPEPQGMEPVAGQSRFRGDAEWRTCAAEHVRMVLATPQEWEGYDVRYLYTAPQVQAMGRVPPGWQAVPVEAGEAIIDALAGPGRVLPAYVGAKEKSDARLAERWRAALAAAPRPPAAPAVIQQLTTEAAPPAYRLLERNVDTIQADDEFLRDADSNWQIDPHGIFTGMPYMSNVLLPARRAIKAAP